MTNLVEARVLLETVELSAALDEEQLTLRLEIYESLTRPGYYSFRLWRLETFRLQSTFPQVEGQPAHAPSDELILKEFEGLDLSGEPQMFPSTAVAREQKITEVVGWLKEVGARQG